MPDDPIAVSVNDRRRQAPRRATRREREQHAVLTLWLAVQRMLRRKSEPPGPSAADAYPPDGWDDGDGLLGSRVPRRPPGSSGSATAAADIPLGDSGPRDVSAH